MRFKNFTKILQNLSRFIFASTKSLIKPLNITTISNCENDKNWKKKNYFNVIKKEVVFSVVRTLINNTMDFFNKVQNMKVQSVECYNFTNMYTNIPLDDLRIIISNTINDIFKSDKKKVEFDQNVVLVRYTVQVGFPQAIVQQIEQNSCIHLT